MKTLNEMIPASMRTTEEAQKNYHAIEIFITNQNEIKEQLMAIRHASDKEEARKAFANQMNDVHTAIHFFGVTGELSNNRHIQRFAATASQIPTLYCAFASINSGAVAAEQLASAGAGVMGTIGTALSAVSPYLTAITAAANIFGVFKKRKSRPDPLAGILQSLFGISQQIYEKLEIMDERNFKMQKFILKTLCDGFGHISNLIQDVNNNIVNRIIDFQLEIRRASDRLQTSVNYWGSLNANRQYRISLQHDYTPLLAHLEAEWEDADRIKNIAIDVTNWLGGNPEKSRKPLTALPHYTGTDLIPNATSNKGLYDAIVNVIFPDENVPDYTISSRRGFLACYAQSLGVPSVISYEDIVDDALWHLLSLNSIEFFANHGMQLADAENIYFNPIKRVAEANIAHIKELQSDNSLFVKLFERYQTALDAISKSINVELTKQNELLGNKVNICNSAAEMIAACSGNYPSKQVVAGGSKYTWYYINKNVRDQFSQASVADLKRGWNGGDWGFWGINVGAYLKLSVQSAEGTAVDFVYDVGMLPHKFPLVFLVLDEKIKLGKITSSYTAGYHYPQEQDDLIAILKGGNAKGSSRCVTVKFTDKTGSEWQIAQFNQIIENGYVTSQSMDIAHEEKGIKLLENFILSVRKIAIQNALTAIELDLQMLEANLRCLKGFAKYIGLREAEQNKLKQLLTAREIKIKLQDYINKGTIDTSLPFIIPNIDTIRHAFMNGMNQHAPDYFQSKTVENFISVLKMFHEDLPKLYKEQQGLQQAAQNLQQAALAKNTVEQEAEQQLGIGVAQGLALGDVFAMWIIAESLKLAGHTEAAKILHANDPQKKPVTPLSFSVMMGMVQALSSKAMNAMSDLYEANPPQREAARWLNKTYSSEEITKKMLTSTFFSQKSLPISEDTRWYEDDDMDVLLKHYIPDQGVQILRGINVNQHHGFTLIENLKADALQQAFLASKGQPVHTLIMPLNLQNLHWAALYVHYDEDNTKPTICYIDPLGSGMPKQIRDALCEVFSEEIVNKTMVSHRQLQQDGYNCGPWTIAILEHLVHHQTLPPEHFDMTQRRKQDAEIMKARQNISQKCV
jgi:hypothetical protein